MLLVLPFVMQCKVFGSCRHIDVEELIIISNDLVCKQYWVKGKTQRHMKMPNHDNIKSCLP